MKRNRGICRMNRMFGVAVIGLAACAGCVSVTGGGHPDSSGWADVFAKDLSNATCAKPGWAWNADGYLVPGTDETLFSNRDYGPFVLDCEYMLDATGKI